MENISDPLTVLVGPNSAGKTNVFRLIELLRDAFHSAGNTSESTRWKDRLKEYTQAYDDPASVRLAVRFGTPEEKSLLRYFWLSCLMRPEDSAFGAKSQYVDQWDRFLEQIVRDLGGDVIIAPLLAGHLELQYHQHSNRYSLFYEFSVGSTTVYWMLEPWVGLTTRLPDPNLSSWSSPSLVQAWSSTWPAELRQRIEAAFSDAPTEIPTLAWDWRAMVSWLQGQVPPTLVNTQAQPESRNQVPLVLQPFWDNLHLPDDGRVWSVRFLWDLLFATRIVVSENLRALPQLRYDQNTWVQREFRSAHLAAYLFDWKTGSRQDRQRFREIQEVTERLSGGTMIDVTANVDLSCSESSSPQVVLDIRQQSRGESYDYSLSTGGAGVNELVYLSSILTSPDMAVVLLDEPGANLHSYALRRLQDYLTERMTIDRGPQVLLITHTPYLVPSEQIQTIRRIYRGSTGTLASEPSPQGQDSQTDGRLAKKHHDFWSRSPNIANLLFYHAVLLVDGPTEVAALSVWYEKHFREPLEARNLTVFSVDGKTSLSFYWRELNLLHVPWVSLVDGDSLRSKSEDGTNLWMAMAEAGLMERTDALTKKELPVNEQIAALRDYGVFFRGMTVNDTFETLAEIQPLLSRIPPSYAGKVRKGLWLAEQTNCPDEFIELFETLRNRSGERASR